MSKIKTEVTELATKLASSFNIDKTSGKTEVTGDPFKDNMPEGLTEEAVKQVDDYRYTFVAATGKAIGEAAIAAMTGNKKLESVEGTFNLGGKSEVTHQILKSKEVFNPSTKETGTKYGAMTTVVKTTLDNQKVGQIGAVRASIGELAVQQLAK